MFGCTCRCIDVNAPRLYIYDLEQIFLCLYRSANIGVFICLKCCGVHRSLGTDISKVASMAMCRLVVSGSWLFFLTSCKCILIPITSFVMQWFVLFFVFFNSLLHYVSFNFWNQELKIYESTQFVSSICSLIWSIF